MIKKAPLCTVHSIENIARHKKDGVGQCTVPTVSRSEILVPQWCHFAESRAVASSSTGQWKCRSVTAEDSS